MYFSIHLLQFHLLTETKESFVQPFVCLFVCTESKKQYIFIFKLHTYRISLPYYIVNFHIRVVGKKITSNIDASNFEVVCFWLKID